MIISHAKWFPLPGLFIISVAMAILGGYAGLIVLFKIKSAISGGGKKVEAA